MAVEARHMNIFSPQLLSNRDFVNYKQDMNHGEFITGETRPTYNFNSTNALPPPSLINAELVAHIQNQQQLEIDQLVAQQAEKLRIEIEARQRTQMRMLASAVQNAVAKELKEKDDEIVRMRNLNYVLQERAKSIYVENQIWRDIAQTNEAQANNLRTNLDQVLSQIKTVPTAEENDMESSCGSCEEGGEAVTAVRGGCKRCGEREASVLVLPCRHLCLCTVCCSALLRTCPVCDSVMNASVHVNMSS